MAGQRKALIIANGEYEQEALRDLMAPEADAEALGRVLADPQIGDFAVQVVRNQPAHVIQAHIEEVFTESRPDDVLLLHFSGHGLKSESGELFFAASNTRPNRLGSTAVPAEFVQRCMRASRSRSVVLLLDCCYGGAFAQGVRVRAAGDVNVLDSFPRGRSGGGRGRAVITASSAMEYAFEGDQLADDQHRRPSVFTNALVEGLETGDADRDEDGWVSLDELYEYVFDKVQEQNPHQTPSRQFELEGELYLARNHRRRIRAAPLPPNLRTALADPNVYTRRGAVSELRSRLLSDDLHAAAGAYEALADLVRNDISYVADPAAAALGEAAVHPADRELHFGRIERGSAPPHRMIQLLGPPIARAYVPHASHDWIHVEQAPEGLDISIDTTGAGTLHGSVNLKGPTGEAAIAIDIDLVSPMPQIRRPDQRGPAPPDSQPPQTSPDGTELAPESGARPSAAPSEPPGHSTSTVTRPGPPVKLSAIHIHDGGPLVFAPLILSIPLFLLTLSRYSTLHGLGWKWAILITAVLGMAVTTAEYRRSHVWAISYEWNFFWLFCFALYGVAIGPKIALSKSQDYYFEAVVVAGAIIEASLFIWVLRRMTGKGAQAVNLLLAGFLGCMAAGLIAWSIGAAPHSHLGHNVNTLRNYAFVAALVLDLLAPVIALTRKWRSVAGQVLPRCKGWWALVGNPPPPGSGWLPADRFAVLSEVGRAVVDAVHGWIAAGDPFGWRRQPRRCLEEDRLVAAEHVVGAVDVPDLVAHGP